MKEAEQKINKELAKIQDSDVVDVDVDLASGYAIIQVSWVT